MDVLLDQMIDVPYLLRCHLCEVIVDATINIFMHACMYVCMYVCM